MGTKAVGRRALPRQPCRAQARRARCQNREVANPLRGYDNPIYIPDDNGYQTVYFYPNGGDSTFQQIAVTIRDGAIEIQGGDTLTIDLQASIPFALASGVTHDRYDDRR